MSRRKSAVVSPSPELTKSILRRSTRLITNRDSDKKPREDLDSGSNPAPIPTEDVEPPQRKSRRELGKEASKRLSGSIEVTKKSPGSNSSMSGFCSVKRTPRVSNWVRSDSERDKSTPLSHGWNKSDGGSSVTTRRSRRFASGGKNLVLGRCNTKVGEKIRRSRVRSNSKEILRDCEEDEVSVCLNKRKRMRISKLSYIDEENVECFMDEKISKPMLGLCASSSEPVLKADRGKGRVGSKSKEILRACEEDEVSVCLSERKKTRISKLHVVEVNRAYNEEENVLESNVECTKEKRPVGLCSTGIVSSSEHVLKAHRRKKIGKVLLDERKEEEEEEEEQSKTKQKLVDRSCNRSRSRVLPKSKEILKACNEDKVSVCLNERKKMRISKPHGEVNGTCNEEEKNSSHARLDEKISKKVLGKEDQLKTKSKPVEESKRETLKGWTKDQELALQRAYLTAKPSPNFWKKVSKMVPGKSAHECFDRMHKDLITPPQPRSRAKKTNLLLSPTPQFSLSASKPSTKPRQQRSRSNQTKKTIRHLLEKQKDQSPGFDLFSVLEPNASNNLFSTPTTTILKTPSSGSNNSKRCSRFKTSTLIISPPVLKQVKNKALHEKYIDHLHIREAKRRAESSKLTGKENVKPPPPIDSVKAAKDAIFFDVQDAIQKLKSIESENSSSSSDFRYDCEGETDEED